MIFLHTFPIINLSPYAHKPGTFLSGMSMSQHAHRFHLKQCRSANQRGTFVYMPSTLVGRATYAFWQLPRSCPFKDDKFKIAIFIHQPPRPKPKRQVRSPGRVFRLPSVAIYPQPPSGAMAVYKVKCIQIVPSHAPRLSSLRILVAAQKLSI